MSNTHLLEQIAQFSDFEAEYYLGLWTKAHQTNATASENKIRPNQLFNNANSGDMARLALLTIVDDSAGGEEWFANALSETPYQGESKNFSQDNNRSASEILPLLAATMGLLGTKIHFSVSGGKIDFSLSIGAMGNPLISSIYQKIVAATPWFNAQTPEAIVAILTPIEVERKAVLAQLARWDPYSSKKTHTLFSVGQFQGRHHRYKIYNLLSGSGVAETTAAIESMMHEFEPDIVLLVVVAGGVKDVQKGDLVIGERAYGYERGKQTGDAFLARPQVYHYSHRLIQQSRQLVDLNNWQERTPLQEEWPKADSARVFFGPIISGNKVLVDSQADLTKFIKSHYNDTLAIEMEAIGCLVLNRYERVRSLNIRGVSD
jgi:nucleoside phosphorylase